MKNQIPFVMIKKFAQILNYEIPDDLKCFVAGCIVGAGEQNRLIKIPMFATGFPIIINITGDLPVLFKNGKIHDYKSRCVLGGQIYKDQINFKFKGLFKQSGIILNPTAPYYLFHKPGAFFLNKWTSINDIVPEESKDIEKLICEDKTSEEEVELVFEMLRKLLPERLPAIPWLELTLIKIFEKHGKIDQSELISNSKISERQFRRIFKRVIGVPPKYFCKVIQLNAVFDLLNNSASDKIHHIALDCGYYDQSHFINDFNKFIGESPENFLNGDHAYIKSYMGNRMG